MTPFVLVAAFSVAVMLLVVQRSPHEDRGALFAYLTTLAGVILFASFGAPLTARLLWAGTSLVLTALITTTAARQAAQAGGGASAIPTYGWMASVLVPAIIAAFYGSYPEVLSAGLILVSTIPLVLVGRLLSDSAWRGVCDAMLLFGLIQLVVAFLEVTGNLSPIWGLLGNDVPEWGTVNNLIPSVDVRAAGTFGHPLPLAMFFVSCVVLAERREYPSLIRCIVYAAALTGIVCTGTRSALLALALVSATMVLRYFKKNFQSALIIATSALLVASVLAFVARIDFVGLVGLRNAGNTLSYTQRSSSAKAFFEVLKLPDYIQVVFGFDPNKLRYLEIFQYRYATKIDAIDNQFVTTLVSGGLLTLSILLITLALIASKGYRGFQVAVFFFVCAISFSVFQWSSGVALVLLLTQTISMRSTPDRFAVAIQGAPNRIALEASSKKSVLGGRR